MAELKVVIAGAGFGGLSAARALNSVDFEITIIDRTNHHLFQPLLYQVASAALSPGDIASPIRNILRNQENIIVIMSEILSFDRTNKRVVTSDGVFIYDILIIALGSRHSYFGNDEWEQFAPGLKTIKDAVRIRERILISFEKAEKCTSETERAKYMTFAIIGGGPTGVEMAGAISEIARKTLLKDFKIINPSDAKIILLEAGNRILPSFPQTLSEKAENDLRRMGVEVLLNTKVEKISKGQVHLIGEIIETDNIIWAAGNKAPSILKSLETETDNNGRVVVNSDCTLPDDSNVFVIGDSARFSDKHGHFLPGIAPVAIQQGNYTGILLRKRSKGIAHSKFSYFDKGNLATIGRAKAVCEISRFKFSGLAAWAIWVFVHILYLINFRNRYKVLTEWIWFYISNRHGIRLITGLEKESK